MKDCEVCKRHAKLARSITRTAVDGAGSDVLLECEEDGCHTVTTLEVPVCPMCGGDVRMVDWATCECDNTHAANNTVCRYCYAKKHGVC